MVRIVNGQIVQDDAFKGGPASRGTPHDAGNVSRRDEAVGQRPAGGFFDFSKPAFEVGPVTPNSFLCMPDEVKVFGAPFKALHIAGLLAVTLFLGWRFGLAGALLLYAYTASQGPASGDAPSTRHRSAPRAGGAPAPAYNGGNSGTYQVFRDPSAPAGGQSTRAADGGNAFTAFQGKSNRLVPDRSDRR